MTTTKNDTWGDRWWKARLEFLDEHPDGTSQEFSEFFAVWLEDRGLSE